MVKKMLDFVQKPHLANSTTLTFSASKPCSLLLRIQRVLGMEGSSKVFARDAVSHSLNLLWFYLSGLPCWTCFNDHGLYT